VVMRSYIARVQSLYDTGVVSRGEDGDSVSCCEDILEALEKTMRVCVETEQQVRALYGPARQMLDSRSSGVPACTVFSAANQMSLLPAGSCSRLLLQHDWLFSCSAQQGAHEGP
jgi:hypothetical protein